MQLRLWCSTRGQVNQVSWHHLLKHLRTSTSNYCQLDWFNWSYALSYLTAPCHTMSISPLPVYCLPTSVYQYSPVCKTYFKIRTCAGTLYPSAPLFVFASGQVLTKSVLNSFIKTMVSQLGWDTRRFSSHSLCAGVASMAAAAGFSDWEIQSLGGWKSQAYTTYIKNIQPHQISFAQRLSNP